MKKIKILITLVLLAALNGIGQTVGTNSLNPIILTSGTTTVATQSPDSLEKWYKLTPGYSNANITSKMISQGVNLPIVSAEVFVYDSGNNLVSHQHDSLRSDSSVFVNALAIPSGGSVYLKYSFDGNVCTYCSSGPTTFNFKITEFNAASCTGSPTGCEFVYNGGFETYTLNCSAMGLTQAYQTYPACNWLIPTSCNSATPAGTSDYYNTCQTNISGYQYSNNPYFNYATTANTGNGCGGFYAYVGAANPANSYREYMMQQLTSSLISGKTYQLKIWLKAANRDYFTKDINLFLGNTYPCQTGTNYINGSSLSGQMISITSAAVTNTASWQLYTVNFTASGNYDKIVLGNFLDNTNTNLVNNSGSHPELYPVASYYYVDDISIKEAPNFTVSYNNSICSGAPSTVTINGQAGSTYTLVPGNLTGTSNIVYPSITTAYTVNATYSTGCTSSTVFTITVLPPYSFNTSASAYTVCSNTAVNLSASGSGLASCIWQPGSLSGLNVTAYPYSTTTYTATGTNTAGCTGTKTITINTYSNALFSLSSSTNNICPNNSTSLTANSGSGTYTFYPGGIVGNNVSVSPSVTTIYTVYGANIYGCQTSNTIAVNVLSNAPVFGFSQPIAYVCPTISAVIQATPSGLSYTWTPGNVNSNSITIPAGTSNSTYTAVTTTTNGCLNSNTIAVSNIACGCLSAPGGSLYGAITPGTYAANSYYKFVSDVTIWSYSADFVTSDITVYPGVKVTVLNGSPGATLNLVGTRMHGCGDLWKGITVEGVGAQLNIIPEASTGKTSLIEDAILAVDAQSQPTLPSYTPQPSNILTIDNATFNHNLTSVRISTYSTNQVTYPYTIKSTLFTSRTITLTASYPSAPVWPFTNTIKNSSSGASTPLQTPYIDNSAYPSSPIVAASIVSAYPDYGIVLDRVGYTYSPGGGGVSYWGITIGGGITNDFNCFDNLKEDFNASNSNFKIVNSVFQNGVRYGGRPGYAFGGKAIVANSTGNDVVFYNNKAEIINGGANGAYPVRFYDKTACTDITGYLSTWVLYAQAYSSQNNYSNLNGINPVGDHGFSIKTNRFQNIEFQNNKVYNIKNAMLIALDNGFYNIGSYTGNGRFAGYINVLGNKVDRVPSSTVTIGSQFINSALSIADPFTSATTVLAPGVGNYVSVTTNSFTNVHNGIDVSNVSYVPVTIATNTITMVNEPNSFGTPTQKGINAVQLLNTSSINQNNVSGVSTYSPGVKAISTSGNAVMAVRCNTVANTARGLEFNGIQTINLLEDNNMNNHTYGLVLDNSAKLTSTLSTFVMGTASRPTNNVWSSSTSWNSTTKIKTATLGSSSAQDGKLYVDYANATLDPNNSGYTSGVPSFPNPSSYTHTAGTFSTSNTLLQATTTVAIGCRISGGGGTGRTSSEGGDDNIIALLEQTTTDSVVYDETTPEAAFINQNMVYRTLAANTDLMNSSSSLGNFFNSAQNSPVKTVFDLENAVAHSEANASSQLNGYTPSNAVETNYKLFYSIYLKTKDSTYNSNDSLMLVNLANSCPYTQGSVVHQARALYNSYYTSYTVFNDNCGNLNGRKINKEPKEGLKVILKSQLYPNPNSGNYTIKFSSITEKQSVEISIFDFSGRTVYMENRAVENSEVKLYTSLLNGVYTVKAKMPDGTYDVHKLIINK